MRGKWLMLHSFAMRETLSRKQTLLESSNTVSAACKQKIICYNELTIMKNKPTAHDRIVRIPGLMGGKPVIKGHRIPVELVVEYLAYDPDLNKVVVAFS